MEATKHFSSGTWRQSLQISRVGSTIYLDEGNGSFEAAADKLQGDRRAHRLDWCFAVEPDGKGKCPLMQ
jgi:hypothetical protein